MFFLKKNNSKDKEKNEDIHIKSIKKVVDDALLKETLSLIDECKELCLIIHKNQEFMKISISLLDRRLNELEKRDILNVNLNNQFADEVLDNINFNIDKTQIMYFSFFKKILIKSKN